MSCRRCFLHDDTFEKLRANTKHCLFQILGCCQDRRRGVGVTTVSNSLILGGWVTEVLENGDTKYEGGRVGDNNI